MCVCVRLRAVRVRVKPLVHVIACGRVFLAFINQFKSVQLELVVLCVCVRVTACARRVSLSDGHHIGGRQQSPHRRRVRTQPLTFFFVCMCL